MRALTGEALLEYRNVTAARVFEQMLDALHEGIRVTAPASR
ncbi:hypothetical protein Q9R20_05565 [Microbacterium sp. PRF11]|nr:hypothetical protein [Microbacterium sp. PRF11]MDT0116455.1 hypothetical protein [Microbacterium sp. PRF11]